MIRKSEFIWNTIASVTTAGLSAVLLLVATRINGANDAGLFAITFATATILNAFGDYGMRLIQVTDTNREYAFKDYLSARFLTAIMMVGIAIVFTMINGYELDKMMLCLLLVLYRFIEAISDTFQGEFQLQQRLDIASQSIFIRTLGAIVIFAVVDILTQNLIYATIGMIIFGIGVSICFDMNLIKKYTNIKLSFDYKKVCTLIKVCFPTFFSMLLNLYIINAPKYAIDAQLTYTMQTIFNVLFLPTFTINLLSLFVLKPMLLHMGVMWNERRLKQFTSLIWKMSGLLILATLFIEVVCYFIGIPMLSLIYGLDLANYRNDLLLLIIAGGLSAFAVMFFYALTTMRVQRLVSIPYILSGITALLICTPLVKEMGIRGATLASILIMVVLFVSSFGIVVYRLRKETRIETLRKH